MLRLTRLERDSIFMGESLTHHMNQMKLFNAIAATAFTFCAAPAVAQESTWLLLSFDRKNNMAVPALSSQVISMTSNEQWQEEGARISKKFRHVRTEFACVPGISQ